MNRDTTTGITQKQRILRDYDEQLYTNILNNLEEMDKFLKSYNLSRLNDEEIENLNRLNTGKDIKSAIKKFPTKKSLGPDSFTGQSYLILKELISTFLKLLQKTEEAEMLPNSFYKASINPATKTR